MNPINATTQIARFAVIVIGSGTVAHSLALAMSARGINTAIIHQAPPSLPPENLDERIFAITPPNRRFLTSIGFWQHLNTSRLVDIAEMRIHPNAHLPSSMLTPTLQLSALSAGVEQLASMVEHRELLRVGDEMVQRRAAEKGGMLTRFDAQNIVALTQNHSSVQIQLADSSVIEAKLLVAADGAESSLRSLLSIPIRVDHYGDACIVGNFKPERFHLHTAEQWFYPDGVIATLPIAREQVSLAWSCRMTKAQELAQNVPKLTQSMVEATHGRLGNFELMSPIKIFPLRRLQSARTVLGRVILAGDSAHLVHPMLGLGLNLGLGDVAEIVRHFGSVPALTRMGQLSVAVYESKRLLEVRAIQTLTHSLHQVYLQNHSILPKVAGLGMAVMQKTPIIKELMIRAITH